MTHPERSTQEAFMSRVRQALKHDRTAPPTQPPPKVNEGYARLARSSDQLLEMFCTRAASVGMNVHRLPADQLVKKVHALVEETSAKNAVVSVGSVAQALPLKESLRRKGVDVIDWTEEPGLEPLYRAHVGITDVHAAIAESGTFVYCSDAGHSRGLWLVPPVHIALVRKSDILPDMIDFWGRFKGRAPGDWPAGMVFITGPSKTADIEGVLVTGVHGPGRVHVVVLEDV
jgi:L-lactate dehydrogenase complex protein LldG